MVYVARNPLSIALSYYHMGVNMKHVGYTGTKENFIESFAVELCKYKMLIFGKQFRHYPDSYN